MWLAAETSASQRATETLNFTGVAIIALLLLNLLLEWRSRPMFQRITLGLTWSLLAVTLLLQFRLHSKISYTLENTNRSIRNHVEFRRLHTAYERVAMVQWFSGLTHLWFVIGLPFAHSSAKHRPDSAV